MNTPEVGRYNVTLARGESADGVPKITPLVGLDAGVPAGEPEAHLKRLGEHLIYSNCADVIPSPYRAPLVPGPPHSARARAPAV